MTTFDPINWRASLPHPHSNSTLPTGTANLHTSDLAHVASIVQGLIAIVQPPASRAGGVAPSTPEHTPLHTAPELSPLQNTPSKLLHFLKYAEQCLGVHNAAGYEDSFHAHGYRPDILHLVDDTALHCIGVSEGDIICLKQNALHWWNLESETNKCKRPNDNANVPGPGGSVQTDAPCMPPNLRVCFEKKYYDGGHMRLYGPWITPGKLALDNDFD
jgi:hypothetical protein